MTHADESGFSPPAARAEALYSADTAAGTLHLFRNKFTDTGDEKLRHNDTTERERARTRSLKAQSSAGHFIHPDTRPKVLELRQNTVTFN